MAEQWVLLCRFLALGPEDTLAEEPGADFSVAIRAPPRVSFLTVALRIHPNPNYIDPDAYLLAAGPSGMLFCFATEPGTGLDVDRDLVVARRFLPATGGQQRPATSTASADLIPKHAAPLPSSYGVGFIGLLSLHGGHHYLITELRFGNASGDAKLLLFFAGHEEWYDIDLFLPLEVQGREFVSVGVLTDHVGHLWWVDLSWGFLSCNPVADEPALVFHTLPPGRVVQSYHRGLHDERCVCESNHKLRFVEIIRGHDSSGRETASVSMWTRIPAADASGETADWEKKYEMSFAKIWNDDSYKATHLPAKVPAIVLVSPSDPNLVYFFLEERLFGINVPAHQVVVFVTEQLPGDAQPPTEPASHVRVLPWILPPSISHDLVEVVAPFQERCASTAATPEPAGTDDEDEDAFQRGLKEVMVMNSETLNSEINRFFGIEEQPRSQRFAQMNREAAWPTFTFQLPEERAMADVEKVFGSRKKRRKD